MSELKKPVTFSDHVQGDPGARVTLVEYGDYECPYYGEAYPVVKDVQRHFGRDLRFVFRNFPLSQSHPHAAHAAETAEFAGALNHFWPAHDALYENQQSLGLKLYVEIVDQLGLSSEDLRGALEEGVYRDRIQADFMGGVRSGVNGTPTFFINGQRFDDAPQFEDLVAAIETVLAVEID